MVVHVGGKPKFKSSTRWTMVSRREMQRQTKKGTFDALRSRQYVGERRSFIFNAIACRCEQQQVENFGEAKKFFSTNFLKMSFY